jgi:hypothetical protein
MRKRILRRKPFVVDGRSYEASVTATYTDVVNLRITFRANFGNRSFCTITGLRNFDYYYHYGYWNDPKYSQLTDTIAVTPRMISLLVSFARENGWLPETEKSNHEIAISNDAAKLLVNQYNECCGNSTQSSATVDEPPAPA